MTNTAQSASEVPLPGFKFFPGKLDRAAQAALVELALAAAAEAPFYTPYVPATGTAMSVQQTSMGALGWMTDKAHGYRYEPLHPQTAKPWPPMPDQLLALWDELADYHAPPESCLINLYRGKAKLGMHVDADEEARDAPVLSISLGDDCYFRVGGLRRAGPTARMKLSSGDVIILSGQARRCFHGVDRVVSGSSTLIPGGGRINLTLRRVTKT